MLPVSFAPMILKMFLGKQLFPKIAEAFTDHIAKMFKLPQVVDYMELPNDADQRIDKLETQIVMLAEDQHPPIFTEEMKQEIVDRLGKLEEFEKQVKRKKAFKRKDGE